MLGNFPWATRHITNTDENTGGCFGWLLWVPAPKMFLTQGLDVETSTALPSPEVLFCYDRQDI